jgi:hypothetical protein
MTIFPSVELALLISIIFILAFLFQDKPFIDQYTFNLIVLLSIITGIGIFSSLLNTYKIIDTVKDLSHYLKPILTLLTGYLIAKKINNTKYLIKSIIVVATVLSIKHIIIFLVTTDFSSIIISDIRNEGGVGSFIELLAMVFLLSSKKWDIFNVFKRRIINRVILTILSFSFIIYFSRTMLLGIVLITLSVMGYTKLNAKGLKYIFIVLMLFTSFYIVLLNVNIDPDKPGIEKFFYKIKNAPSEIFSSPDGYDPRNHKRIFDRWRAYEAKMALEKMQGNYLNYFIGKGFGSLVDLKFKAPLNSEGMRYVPIIHNGYVYIFFKTGIIGLLFYLLFLISLYAQSYKKTYSLNERAIRNLISGVGLYYIFSSLIITGIYNLEEILSLLLGTILFMLIFTRKNATEKIEV